MRTLIKRFSSFRDVVFRKVTLGKNRCQPPYLHFCRTRSYRPIRFSFHYCTLYSYLCICCEERMVSLDPETYTGSRKHSNIRRHVFRNMLPLLFNRYLIKVFGTTVFLYRVKIFRYLYIKRKFSY